MPTLSQLAQLLIACRVTTPELWQRAAKAGGGHVGKTLDALAAEPPWWASAEGELLPGLSEYQRGVIDLWFEEDGPPPHRQLALNRFILLEKLGQGGQGEVYRARQLNPARFVAIKTLTQDTESRRQRFEQEARAMMKMRHPGVARFHLYERVRDAAGTPTDEYLIAMEYVEGTDLARLVNWRGPVPWAFAVRWAVDLLGGLAVIHHNGFIHRDVKPGNVMILGRTPEPGTPPVETAAKLLDFGAVKPAADETQSGGTRRVFVGTREYAPPEQWEERVVPASDLYALGGTLFFALTGRPPYEIEGRDAIAFMRAHSRAPIPDVREYNPDVPVPLSRLIRRLLAKDANDRGTAAELIGDFRELLPPEARDAITDEPPPPPPAVSKPASKPSPAAPVEAAEESEHSGATGSLLAVLERMFLPQHLRPQPGHEPPAPERVAALLRRPVVLITLLVLFGLLIFLLTRL
jgi:eukaryotic-like serine/threonine-protein kinase